MTLIEIQSKLANSHLNQFLETLKPYNGGDTYTITVNQFQGENLADFVERASRVTKRLQMEFIVISSENCFDKTGYTSEIEFTYGLD